MTRNFQKIRGGGKLLDISVFYIDLGCAIWYFAHLEKGEKPYSPEMKREVKR